MRARVAVLPVVNRVILALVLAVERGEVSAVMYPVLVAIIRTHPPNISKFQYVLRLKVWEYNAGSASGPHHRRTIGSATKSESFAGIFREAHAHSSVCLVHGVVPAPQALTFQHEAPGGDLKSDLVSISTYYAPPKAAQKR